MKWDGPLGLNPVVSMDRFSQGRPDPCDSEPIGRCDWCGRLFYDGDEVYLVDGGIICEDRDCWKGYFEVVSITLHKDV